MASVVTMDEPAAVLKENVNPQGGLFGQFSRREGKLGLGGLGGLVGGGEPRSRDRSGVLAPNATLGNSGAAATLDRLRDRVRQHKLESRSQINSEPRSRTNKFGLHVVDAKGVESSGKSSVGLSSKESNEVQEERKAPSWLHHPSLPCRTKHLFSRSPTQKTERSAVDHAFGVNAVHVASKSQRAATSGEMDIYQDELGTVKNQVDDNGRDTTMETAEMSTPVDASISSSFVDNEYQANSQDSLHPGYTSASMDKSSITDKEALKFEQYGRPSSSVDKTDARKQFSTRAYTKPKKPLLKLGPAARVLKTEEVHVVKTEGMKSHGSEMGYLPTRIEHEGQLSRLRAAVRDPVVETGFSILAEDVEKVTTFQDVDGELEEARSDQRKRKVDGDLSNGYTSQSSQHSSSGGDGGTSPFAASHSDRAEKTVEKASVKILHLCGSSGQGSEAGRHIHPSNLVTESAERLGDMRGLSIEPPDLNENRVSTTVASGPPLSPNSLQNGGALRLSSAHLARPLAYGEKGLRNEVHQPLEPLKERGEDFLETHVRSPQLVSQRPTADRSHKTVRQRSSTEQRDGTGNTAVRAKKVEIVTKQSLVATEEVKEGATVSGSQNKRENAHFVWVNGRRYQKLAQIGKGGSSEVFQVIDQDHKIYALKKINLKGREYSTARGFYQEIEYLRRLQGKPHVVELIACEVTNQTVVSVLTENDDNDKTDTEKKITEDAFIYMVLEYGEIDLAGLLSKKRKQMAENGEDLDSVWVGFFWKHMLVAVKTIHDERMVHADLKPANFLLVRGELKLIDFGIAKAIQNDTTHISRDNQVGTLNYMSPEAFMTNSLDEEGRMVKCGRASDIWSLGCILYQMVYGRTPFSHINPLYAKIQAITSKTFKIDFPPIPNIWLIDIMKQCLTWDRHKRPHISDLLNHPFFTAGT